MQLVKIHDLVLITINAETNVLPSETPLVDLVQSDRKPLTSHATGIGVNSDLMFL